MSEEERELPEPPKPLLSDEMAMAIAQGKLEEFLQKRFPDNEHARMLASMMAGLSGMFMPDSSGRRLMAPPPKQEKPEEGKERTPEEVRLAAESGDVEGLMGLLAREHEKRTGEKPPLHGPAEPAPQKEAGGEPVMEKELLDALLKMAEENNISVDWLVARALRLYMEEYKRTGKL